MHKLQAVASLGQRRLMLPGWVNAALSANDRLKVYLTILQAAASHAVHLDQDAPDLAKETTAAGLNVAWLHDLVAAARKVDDDLLIPDMPRIVKCLVEDLATMARPVLETATQGAESHSRLGCISAARSDIRRGCSRYFRPAFRRGDQRAGWGAR